MKQTETKDQTRKVFKIKGSNDNLSRDLITKLQKTSEDQIENIHLNVETAPLPYLLSPSRNRFQQ